ncbi:hypothetical protein KNO81_39210 [Paraburkholderia sediminicola]|nr:hypothetical protein [Paraburkholderia sediminicola]
MKSRFSPISLSSDALAHACGAQGCAWTNVFSGVKLWAICGAIRKGNCQLLAEGSNPITLAPRPSVFDAPPLKIAVDNDAANPSLEIDCDGGMPKRPQRLACQAIG